MRNIGTSCSDTICRLHLTKAGKPESRRKLWCRLAISEQNSMDVGRKSESSTGRQCAPAVSDVRMWQRQWQQIYDLTLLQRQDRVLGVRGPRLPGCKCQVQAWLWGHSDARSNQEHIGNVPPVSFPINQKAQEVWSQWSWSPTTRISTQPGSFSLEYWGQWDSWISGSGSGSPLQLLFSQTPGHRTACNLLLIVHPLMRETINQWN